MSLSLDNSDQGGVLKRPDAAQLQDAHRRREVVLARLRDQGHLAFKGAKPHIGTLSPGCQRCGEGAWSCLFLNAVCHATCFFCPGYKTYPAAPPHAERIVFTSPEAYASYVERLGFRGVSFSGGEPFLSVDRMVRFIQALRTRLGDAIYIWAYSNGTAVGRDVLQAAVDAGLDEIRFNIVHADYKLSAVAKAVRIAPRVTVEIPSVPEDARRLRDLLPRLEEVGVRHLNLHQLMIMGENAPALIERGYTFMPGPVAAVLESEIAALETIASCLDQGVQLPINYCSMIFKARWQNRVEDLRAGALLRQPWEVQTQLGLLRRVFANARDGDVTWDTLIGAGIDVSSQQDAARGCVYLTIEAAALAVAQGVDVFAEYTKTVVGEPEVSDAMRRRTDYTEIDIGPEKVIGARRILMCHPLSLSADDVAMLARGKPPEALRPYEIVAPGLDQLVDLDTGT